jgi:hypothetical protein
MITVIGIFTDPALAEQVSDYLLANEFKSENIDLHTHSAGPAETDRVGDLFTHLFDDQADADHYATLGRNGTIVTVHALSTREAHEAVDAFNNHGAVDVSVDSTGNRSLVIEKITAPEFRLRGTII